AVAGRGKRTGRLRGGRTARGCRRAAGGTGEGRCRLPPAAHLARLPLGDDGTGAGAVPCRSGARVTTGAAHPAGVDRDRRLVGDDAAQSIDYWTRHLREPVRFSTALERVLERPARVLLEVGPRATLCSLARQQPLLR